jgi:hypothetical protein
LLPKWVIFVDTIRDLAKKRGCFVVADEMALRAHARDHESRDNKDWAKLMAVARQRHHFLMFICQHSRQPDLALVMDPGIIIMKRPSHLHVRFARPELRPEIERAWLKFRDFRGNKKGKAYVVDYHDLREGFLDTKLPTFWSEELSEVFGEYELAQLLKDSASPAEDKKKAKKGKRGRA